MFKKKIEIKKRAAVLLSILLTLIMVVLTIPVRQNTASAQILNDRQINKEPKNDTTQELVTKAMNSGDFPEFRRGDLRRLFAFLRRGDIRQLPFALQLRLLRIAARPHSYLPLTVFSEADDPSRLFQYYAIDTRGFEPNVFTATIPGINDGTKPTATGPNGDLPTIGAIRLVLEPKPGLPTDPNDPRAFIDIFTDVSGLFVINNESGWYEGWMIRDIKVPRIAAPRANGRAQYGTMTQADAAANAMRGDGNNAVPGRFVTTDGNRFRPFSAADRFPEIQSNGVPIPVSLGTFNSLQQSDIHAYWEFNPGTNFIFPHYELPFTGGTPGSFANRMPGGITSIVPGSGPAGTGPRPFQSILNGNDPLIYGDNPNNPRDPDRAEVSSLDDFNRPMLPNPANLETRLRFIPSRLTEEVLFDVMVRRASFEPTITNVGQRFFLAMAYEIALIDQNTDGVLSFQEVNINGTSDGGQPNTRLYLAATAFNRYAMTRELNDGLLAPRFGPGQRGYVLAGDLVPVNPSVPASVPQDADNR